MVEKLRMETKDITQDNVEKIATLFPNCIVESNIDGKIVRAVDFDLLKQELTCPTIDGTGERYQFTWPDKSKSKLLANTPTNMTLRPSTNLDGSINEKDSVDFWNTKNLYIEGDNLDVLKLLRETYLNKVKLIYIDPPYNTGNDFVYIDNYSMNQSDYSKISGDYDSEGNRLDINLTSNGRFHSNWLNMIYPRLKLARDLLRDDGAIFISIDDNEVHNMKKICDEIFNENNFIAQMVIEGTPKNDPLIISTAHEYCLVYVKNLEIAKKGTWGVTNPVYGDLIKISKCSSDFNVVKNKLKEYYDKNNLSEDNISNYKFVDEKGVYRIGPIDDPQGCGPKDVRINPKTNNPLKIPSRGWSCNLATWNQWVSNGLVEFPDDDSKLCAKKTYIESDKLEPLRAHIKMQTRKDTDNLKRLFDDKSVFNFPKPVEIIKNIIECSTKDDDIVLDFFSGSGTTAHAVFESNIETNSHRKFILVQIQEDLEQSLLYAKSNRVKNTLKNAIEFCDSLGVPKNICEIGKERIRRIKSNYSSSKIDCGFRVFKLDSSNMKDVYYSPNDIKKKDLSDYVDNIKPDRHSIDLLFQCMIELGIELSVPIKEEIIDKKTVFNVDDGYLLASFDSDVTENTITQIAKMKPVVAVFRDSSIDSDSTYTNYDQIFKTYSPSTDVRIL